MGWWSTATSVSPRASRRSSTPSTRRSPPAPTSPSRRCWAGYGGPTPRVTRAASPPPPPQCPSPAKMSRLAPQWPYPARLSSRITMADLEPGAPATTATPANIDIEPLTRVFRLETLVEVRHDVEKYSRAAGLVDIRLYKFV